MPPLPGERVALIAFADVHSYFAPPTSKPIYHRFDKGSYLYILQDDSQGRARIEVANNPGTPDQDAFNGALDRVHLRHSCTFPTLCTLTVNALAPSPAASSPSPNAIDQRQWLLPSGDTRDESKRLLPLHTLDIYFWTVDDANAFLDAIERVLPREQVETDRQPQQQTAEPAVSSVVQNLEKVAITDPAYQNGQTRDSRSFSASIAQSIAPAVSAQRSSIGSHHSQRESKNYAPLPYNPSAPAAPEPIKHREKTPPPLDGAQGTGLSAAAAADEGHPYATAQLAASQPTGDTIPGAIHPGYGTGRDPNPNAHLFPQQPYPQYAEYPQTPVSTISSPTGIPYSNYPYYRPPQQDGDVHAQVFVPLTDAEKKHVHNATGLPNQPGAEPHRPGQLVVENTASRIERNLNYFLKKLEKKI